jgi:vacuolar-type H+-ATPase subunit H
VTDDIATLKAIKEREEESKKRLELARAKGAQIVSEAREKAKKILSDAEEEGRNSYSQFMKKEMEATSGEVLKIRKRFEEEAGKLKRDISKEIVEKMVRVVMESNE